MLSTTARHHLAGYGLCEELYKAAFDLSFYSEAGISESYNDMADRLRKQYLLLPVAKGDSFPLHFAEMLGGDSPGTKVEQF
jgi:hypothetical protein